MRPTNLFMVFLLAVFGAACVVQATGAEEKEMKPANRVVLKSIRVMDTKKDGSTWDINSGKPDIRVIVRNLSDPTIKAFPSPQKEDQFEATFDLRTILVIEGQKLEFEVQDVDVADNDLIGKVQKEITADILKQGKLELSFDRVSSLTVEFQKP